MVHTHPLLKEGKKEKKSEKPDGSFPFLAISDVDPAVKLNRMKGKLCYGVSILNYLINEDQIILFEA